MSQVAPKNVPKRPVFAPKDGTSLAMGERKLPTLHFAPNTFLQSNLTGFENIVKSIRAFVPENARVLELYGGVGTIGLHLSDRVAELDCSDENPNNQEQFNMSRKLLTKKQQKVVKPYSVASAEDKAHEITKYDTIIVDPPRKGLCAGVRDALVAATGPRRLVYVSCGFTSFKKDCTALLEAGWKLIHAEGHILFPGADHLETCSFFARDLEIARPGQPKASSNSTSNNNNAKNSNNKRKQASGSSSTNATSTTSSQKKHQTSKKAKVSDVQEEDHMPTPVGIVPDFDDE